MKRAIGAITLAALVSVGLTACDPPMPPDVAAQIAEQTFTCVPGNSTISYPELMADISQGLSDSLAAACVPPLDEMTSSIVGPGEPADIMISDYPVDCPALLTVPYATEAADLITNFADGFSINLSPATAAKILNGEITNWGDAAIAKENPDVELPKEPIVVRQSVDKNALLAMKKWFAHFGAEITHDFNTTTTQLFFDQMAEGEIAILPHSVGVNAGLTPTSIIVGRADGADVLALADTNGIGSAATQWVATQKGKNVTVKLDFKQEPLVQSGFDTAEVPYQAIYPVNLTLCGENSLLNRANANFLLRLDSQGSLGASSYNPLSESVRAISLMAVRIGLPQPTEAPASN